MLLPRAWHLPTVFMKSPDPIRAALCGATFTWGMQPPCAAQKEAQMAVDNVSLDWAPAKTDT